MADPENAVAAPAKAVSGVALSGYVKWRLGQLERLSSSTAMPKTHKVRYSPES